MGFATSNSSGQFAIGENNQSLLDVQILLDQMRLYILRNFRRDLELLGMSFHHKRSLSYPVHPSPVIGPHCNHTRLHMYSAPLALTLADGLENCCVLNVVVLVGLYLRTDTVERVLERFFGGSVCHSWLEKVLAGFPQRQIL